MINILEESLINKIAAGEVIERPASVVKELLENSLDAKADSITVYIEEGGLRKIKIVDNGSGMNREDAKKCYLRHATSKISNEEDLFDINTLGFRGEALASIVEIANVKITTKVTEGFFIEIEAGKVLRNETVAANTGTTIEVSDLFFNVPARKKYMKGSAIEARHIMKLVMQYALINFDKSLKLIIDGKEVLACPKTEDLLEGITSVYGTEVSKNLVKVDYLGKIRLIGYVSKPILTRADHSGQSLYINKRYVKSDALNDAIYEAYRSMLFVNRHPVYVLDITIDPKEIDVNVHPQKTAIRLKKEEQVQDEISNALKQAFQSSSLIPEVNADQTTTQKPIQHYSFDTHTQTVLPVKEAEFDYQKEIVEKIGPFNILGQVNKTFIIAECAEGLAIIDQHAAQERVNYEKFLLEKKDGAIKRQRLLTPKVLELTPDQFAAVKNNKELIESLGFNYDLFGDKSIKLASVPEIFGKLKSTLFIDIVTLLQKPITEDIEKRIIRFSCRASVKAGDELTKPQMIQLLEDLGKTENPYTCPHGRPTIISFTVSELEKKFKRSGW